MLVTRSICLLLCKTVSNACFLAFIYSIGNWMWFYGIDLIKNQKIELLHNKFNISILPSKQTSDMFKSALISLLLTFTLSNAQFIPASTGGFYDLRGSPTALSATGIELSITGVESEHQINYLRPTQRRLLEVSTFEPIPCKEGSNNTDCVCPGKCLAYTETNDGKNGCFPNKYEYLGFWSTSIDDFIFYHISYERQ